MEKVPLRGPDGGAIVFVAPIDAEEMLAQGGYTRVETAALSGAALSGAVVAVTPVASEPAPMELVHTDGTRVKAWSIDAKELMATGEYMTAEEYDAKHPPLPAGQQARMDAEARTVAEAAAKAEADAKMDAEADARMTAERQARNLRGASSTPKPSQG